MDAAIKNGTNVVWLATEDKYVNFFGYRSLYDGYLSNTAKELFKKCSIYCKHSHKMGISKDSPFSRYFETLSKDGWNLCWDNKFEEYTSLANTPENYSLGVEMEVNGKRVWMLSPPTSDEGIIALVNCAIEQESTYETSNYEGIFLSHNSDDKPFARHLKEMLNERGVNNVWIDEAEIQIGDSLLQKIAEGITKTTYFGIVLSKNSVKSAWVSKELEIALTYEIGQKSVKVLPILIEPCDMPPFLISKLYADFTNEDKYEESLKKILRRLKK